MPGTIIIPGTDFIGGASLGTLDFTSASQEVEKLPGIQMNFWPEPEWYSQSSGPSGYGWYSKSSRDNRIDSFIPFSAAKAPALTASLIGTKHGIQFSGGADEILIPGWGTVATATVESSYMDDMALNLTEGSIFTVVKTVLNVSSYIFGPVFKPQGIFSLGAGGGECMTLLLSPVASGAQQYVRVLYGNGAARMGTSATTFQFTTAASIGYTWHPTRGTAMYINNVQVAVNAADFGGMNGTGRFQIGRRGNGAASQATHKQGMFFACTKALDDAGPYGLARTAAMKKIHTHYAGDLPAL